MAGLSQPVNSVIRVPLSFHVSALPSTGRPLSFWADSFLEPKVTACNSQDSVPPSSHPAGVSLSQHCRHDPGAHSDWTSVGHVAMAESVTWPGGWTELTGLD